MQYEGPIIDAHHHLWDYSMAKHPWLRPQDQSVQALGNLDKIQRNFLPADYLQDLRDQGIVGSVHIEALWDDRDPVAETQWLDSLDKPHGVAARYVAGAPLGTDRAAQVLRTQSAFDRVVGVRGILSHHPSKPEKSFVRNPNLSSDPSWRRDVALIAAMDLHLELMIYPYQGLSVCDLARDFPHLTIVINHCGSPIDQDEEGLARWREALRTLAREPNIHLKVSDIAAYVPDWTEEVVREIVNECVQTFGDQRCMFGSDYPVVELEMPIKSVFSTFKNAIGHLGTDAQRRIMHDNAFKLYRF
ncbi:amidohydrolase family protein [Rhizobium sp. R693]|uniref:amidohydrolase family protein n=1 Tax=Rhizobium sp. R693 TaxID=1764276 RepID=UPI000B5375C9|nr:amidohydrolase family protein [Rhizobium sp. R693]OWV98706.1 hypothetical protein ATY79_18710 [Rhizobium sp. R693]